MRQREKHFIASKQIYIADGNHIESKVRLSVVSSCSDKSMDRIVFFSFYL